MFLEIFLKVWGKKIPKTQLTPPSKTKPKKPPHHENKKKPKQTSICTSNLEVAFTNMQDMSEFSFILQYVNSALLNTMTYLNTPILNLLHQNVFWLVNMFPSDKTTVHPVNSAVWCIVKNGRWGSQETFMLPFWADGGVPLC